MSNYFDDNHLVDYIIFQEVGCAYYYFKLFKKFSKGNRPKTVLVIHTEDDSGSMLMNTFNGFGRKRYATTFQ